MTQGERDRAYRVLGLRPGADFAAVQASWRRLVRRHHPDIAPGCPEAAARRMAEINAAFQDLRRDLAARSAARPGRGAAPMGPASWAWARAMQRRAALAVEEAARGLRSTSAHQARAISGGDAAAARTARIVRALSARRAAALRAAAARARPRAQE